jgi:DNA-binding Lrp family transcriptional regulator
MQVREVPVRNSFPNEPLDEKDREIIVRAYKYGPEGIGFNKLVRELQPLLSRSTVALRLDRLVRLGYLERTTSSKLGGIKPARLTFKCYSLMSVVDVTKRKSTILREGLQNGAMQFSSQEEFAHRYDRVREGWSALFSMIGTVAVFYGQFAASDLFLPLVFEEYKNLSIQFFELLGTDPKLRNFSYEMMKSRAAEKGVNVEKIMRETMEQQEKWRKSSTFSNAPTSQD